MVTGAAPHGGGGPQVEGAQRGAEPGRIGAGRVVVDQHGAGGGDEFAGAGRRVVEQGGVQPGGPVEVLDLDQDGPGAVGQDAHRGWVLLCTVGGATRSDAPVVTHFTTHPFTPEGAGV